jgi:hypothetical protein
MNEKNPDLRAAYRTLDPAKSLEGTSLLNYYTQRPGIPTAKLAEEIKERSQPFRAILAGQRGVGKTTELNWLKEELGRAHQCAFLLDLGRVVATNAATALAFVTVELARQNPPLDLDKLLQNRQWAGLDFEVGVHPQFLPEIVRTLKELKAAIQAKQGQEPVLLLDGWERVTSNAEVYPFMSALEGVSCSTVLVTRLSVILEPEFNHYKADWDLTILPAIPLFTYDRAWDSEGWSLLASTLERRAWKQAFQADALRVIIPASGGLFRELVSLGRHACLLAERAGKDAVTSVEADAALREQRLKYTATLTAGDLEVLRQFLRTNRAWADRGIFEQVNQGRIVSYYRDSLWFDVHPILWPLLSLEYPPPPRLFY